MKNKFFNFWSYFKYGLKSNGAKLRDTRVIVARGMDVFFPLSSKILAKTYVAGVPYVPNFLFVGVDACSSGVFKLGNGAADG